MRKTIIILSIFLFMLCTHTTSAQDSIRQENTGAYSNEKWWEETTEDGKPLFRVDTMADGGLSITPLVNKNPRLNPPPLAPPQRPKYGVKTEPVMFYIYGIFLVVLGAVALYERIKGKKSEQKHQKGLQAFKENADKVLIRLSDCKIEKYRSHFHTPERTYRQQQRDWADTKMGMNRNHTIEIPRSKITFEAEVDGVTKVFEYYVNKDALTLTVLFGHKEISYLYVDKKNRESFYFDLEFLDR
jgi:hypothetical protein